MIIPENRSQNFSIPDFSTATVRTMMVVNRTPDSFSDGGHWEKPDDIIEAVGEALDHGVDIIDLGGESTRPGARCIPVEIEQERVIPVIKALLRQYPKAFISIDTRKSAVAQAAIDVGAQMINDVSGFMFDSQMLDVVAQTGAYGVITHSQGTPDTMQHNPTYQDVVSEVKAFLREQRQKALQKGIPSHKILLDPGFGFGKTVEHNLDLLRHLSEFQSLGHPLVVGTSRKSFLTLGNIDAILPQDREALTAASLAAAIHNGAKVVRIHDVKTQLPVIRFLERLKTNLSDKNDAKDDNY